MSKKNNFTKNTIHADFPKTDPHGALSMPVYHSVAFEFDSAEAMERAFTGKSTEYLYSRIANPTVQHFEDRIRQITGSLTVRALNSGMAAISNSIMTVAFAGANIITSKHLFGNTYSFFTSTLATFGVETRFCDLTNKQEIEQNLDENTCAVFVEIISNPQMEVIDLKAIASLLKAYHVPFIADTTIIPFCTFHASAFGIDIEVISSTKYISGGATSVGGLIVDYGLFDWKQTKKFQGTPDEHRFSTFTLKLNKEILRNLGAYMSPQTAYMQTLGLETLELRYKRASHTAGKLAEALETSGMFSKVCYPGLKGNRYFDISSKQFGAFPGAMLTFDLSSQAVCFAFLNRLKLIKRATNLFDNKSLAIHPYSTIYGNYSKEDKANMHISDKTIRLSVGLEEVEDLYQDIMQAIPSQFC